MRLFVPILLVLPALALADVSPEGDGGPVSLPAGVGMLVQRTEAAREAVCTAALVGCHFAAVAADCVGDAADPKSLTVFLPHAGRFDVDAVVRRSVNAAKPGIVLLRLARAVTGVTPFTVPAAAADQGPANLVGFGSRAHPDAHGGDVGLACAAGVRLVACEPGADDDPPRVCWSSLPQATPAPAVAAACAVDRNDVLVADGQLLGVAPSAAGADATRGAHRAMAADASFLRDVLGDEFGQTFCGVRARVGGPAVQASGFDGALSPETLQAEQAIRVDEGTTSLVVALNAENGSDFDLFLEFGSPATVSAFDCSDVGPGTVHVCEIIAPKPGAWHVLVSRTGGAGRFQVRATRYGPPCADPVNDGRDCDDGNGCTSGDRCAAAMCRGAAVASAVPCDDGDPCTRGDACADGVCVGASACGDGEVQKPCEECDDGNAVAGDGCEPDCRVTRKDAFVGYLVRPSRVVDNRLPRNWNLNLDDTRIDAGEADDPENYSVDVAQHVLLPAAAGAARAPGEPGQAFLRYRIQESAQGVGAADDDGRYPRAARHIARQWRVETDDGTVVVESKTVAAMLVPARIGKGAVPEPGRTDDAFVCYTVRVARGSDSALAPEGRFTRGLQRFLADGFRDCSGGAGSGPFRGSGAEGKCLYDLQKPVELCNPVAVAPVEAPRTTSVPDGTGIESVPGTASSLLCFQAQRAARVRSEAVAEALGVRIGEVINPRQAAHRKRLAAEGRPLFVRPGNGIPAPTRVDTMRPELVCVPALASLEP
jgi:cysteine-rich repeat protein